MKIFLDDVRTTPHDWVRVYSVNQFMEAVKNSKSVTEVSLDHDLGDYHEDGGDGYAAALWLAELGYVNGFWIPTVIVHSANPVGSERMLSILEHYGPYHRLGHTLQLDA